MRSISARSGRALRGALFSLVLLFASSPARAEEKISDEAKLYFRNGVELIQANPPNYQDAYYQFKLAYEKSGSWKVLGNLGLCALKLERDGEALDAYTEYLNTGGKQVDPEERKALERDSLLISGNSAVVNVTSDVVDAALVDARAGSNVPPQSYKLAVGALSMRLRAGTHTLTASTSDGHQLRWEVTITPGQTLEHRFDFAAAAAPAPVVAPVPAAQPAPVLPASLPEQNPEPHHGGALRTVGFVGLGVGGAAIVGGVITGLMAKSKESSATDQCHARVCPTKAESDFDSAHSLATVTNVLFIGGGVLAAAGVTLVIVGGKSSNADAPKAAAAPRLRLTPAFGSGAASLLASGAF
jgi:hypothetical protein